jgi:hypothetical protein
VNGKTLSSNTTILCFQKRWEVADPDILFQPRTHFPTESDLADGGETSCHSSSPSYYLFFHCFILSHICFIYVVACPRRSLMEEHRLLSKSPEVYVLRPFSS